MNEQQEGDVGLPRFFSDEIFEQTARIRGEDARHIAKVLRMQPGEVLTVCDLNGKDYECTILHIAEHVELRIDAVLENETEPDIQITLYPCLPKGDKLEFIVQKAVELGVWEIVPVMSRFCTAKTDAERFEKRLPRLQKIAKEAAKQSGRGIIPQVRQILSFNTAVERACAHPALIFYEGGGQRVSELVPENTKKIGLLIGSEGGFSSEEVALATQKGIRQATMGKRILRCETAAVAGITLVHQMTGNM